MTNEVNWWLETYRLLPVAVVGAIAAGIAYRQWVVAHEKLRLDLFEKRMEVFNLIHQFTSAIVRNNSPSQEDFKTSWSAINKATFLFGNDVLDFLKHVHVLGTKLHSDYNIIANGRGPNYEAAVERQQRCLLEINDVFENLHAPFEPYMKFENQLGRRTWFDCARDYFWR